MSRIAIVSAMHQELRALLQVMPDQTPQRLAGREFWVGHLDGHEVVAVLSGIGKVAAATTATLLLSHFGVSRILFTGAAGGLGTGVAVGDVVVATELLQHDMDASPLFPRHEVPLYGLSRFASAGDLSDAVQRAAEQVVAEAAAGTSQTLPKSHLDEFSISAPRVHRGLIISGDRFVCGHDESAALRAELPDALAVEMEGAALAQVCHDCAAPFAVVRTVSDRADDSAHVDFNRFIDEVASRYTLAIVRASLGALDGAH